MIMKIIISIIIGMMSIFLNSFSFLITVFLISKFCCVHLDIPWHHSQLLSIIYEDHLFLFLINYEFLFRVSSWLFFPSSLILCFYLFMYIRVIHHPCPSNWKMISLMEMTSFFFSSFFLFLIIPFSLYRFFSHFRVTVLVFISLCTSFTSHFHHDWNDIFLSLITLSFSHVFFFLSRV